MSASVPAVFRKRARTEIHLGRERARTRLERATLRPVTPTATHRFHGGGNAPT